MSFLDTGTVLKIPTLISVGVVFLTAVMIFLSGVILHVLKKQHDQNFEQHLTLIRLARDAGNKKDN